MNLLSRKSILAIPAALILAAVGFVYSPVLRGGWLWDDNVVITNNRLVKDPKGLPKIWFASDNLDYYPLKASVEWLEWRMWGENPMGYRVLNFGLHALSALLFWRLLRMLGVNFAWLGGLLFAVHPLAVESVAWISELKNTLSLPFLLLAMICYVEFDTKCWRVPLPRSGTRQRFVYRTDYLCSLGFFLAALLCKSSVVMFPVVLLLYAWWRRGRISRGDVLASAGFFALSFILGLVTVIFQFQRTELGSAVLAPGLFPRLEGALRAVIFYFAHCLWPIALMPVYPAWPLEPVWPELLVCLVGAVICGLAAWRFGGGRSVALGLGCFVVNLVPVLGFIPMTFMRIAPVSDHLVYLPLMGVVGLAAGGAGMILGRRSGAGRWAAWAAVLAIVALLAVRSRDYAAVFHSEEALWTFAVRENPNTWLGEYNLAIAVRDSGRESEAIGHFDQALRLRPVYPEAHYNLAICLEHAGRTADAIAHLEQAVQQQPNYVPALNQLGLALAGIGQGQEAIARYEQALRYNPNYYEADNNLANALLQAGRTTEALALYERVLQFQPTSPDVHYNLGLCLANSSRRSEAAAQFEEALRLKSVYPEADFRLGIELVEAGRLPEAISHYERALRLIPDFPEGEENLGVALAKSGRLADAIPHFERAVQLRPAYAKAQQDLGQALGALGRADEARRHLEEAARLRAAATENKP